MPDSNQRLSAKISGEKVLIFLRASVAPLWVLVVLTFSVVNIGFDLLRASVVDFGFWLWLRHAVVCFDFSNLFKPARPGIPAALRPLRSRTGPAGFDIAGDCVPLLI